MNILDKKLPFFFKYLIEKFIAFKVNSLDFMFAFNNLFDLSWDKSFLASLRFAFLICSKKQENCKSPTG